jgi:predicted kinase
MELVLLVGLPGAGKTSFFRHRFAATHVLVSGDLIRNRRNSRRKQLRRVAEALAAGRSVVVDNTNPTAAGRAEFVDLGKRHGTRVRCYFFPPDVALSLERNAQRKGRGRVPPVAIYSAMKRMEEPSLREGFDRLYVVEAREPGEFVIREPLGHRAGTGKSRGPEAVRSGVVCHAIRNQR